MKSETFQIASDIQWEDAGDGVVRQIYASLECCPL